MRGAFCGEFFVNSDNGESKLTMVDLRGPPNGSRRASVHQSGSRKQPESSRSLLRISTFRRSLGMNVDRWRSTVEAHRRKASFDQHAGSETCRIRNRIGRANKIWYISKVCTETIGGHHPRINTCIDLSNT